MTDLRLLRRGKQPVEVVIAIREFGASFADSAAVAFHYYALTHNADGIAGWPTYYFKHDRVVRATQPYCDVNKAFDRELGLGSSGLGSAEGGH